MCVVLKEQPAGIYSLLIPCGADDQTLFVTPGNSCLNPLTYLGTQIYNVGQRKSFLPLALIPSYGLLFKNFAYSKVIAVFLVLSSTRFIVSTRSYLIWRFNNK